MTEQVKMIPIHDLHPFQNHPFHVKDDEALASLRDSIREYGVLSPLLARRKGEGYELVSGHRRRAAALKLGMMLDSNIQRENLLPIEKAFAYKMKFDALMGTFQDSVLVSLKEVPRICTCRYFPMGDVIEFYNTLYRQQDYSRRILIHNNGRSPLQIGFQGFDATWTIQPGADSMIKPFCDDGADHT